MRLNKDTRVKTLCQLKTHTCHSRTHSITQNTQLSPKDTRRGGAIDVSQNWKTARDVAEWGHTTSQDTLCQLKTHIQQMQQLIS